MAHGWNSYFHNPQPLPSDSGALRRTSESESHLSHHIENFTGHHGFASTVASQEAPVFNSGFNMNYCSDPSGVSSRSDCVYQRYCSETQWQADEEQMRKDYLQKCENGNIPDFATEGLQTTESFPSSFTTDCQGFKQACGMPTTSFLEHYSDVNSCSNADASETRPPCKFMASNSDVPTKQSSSAWFFTPTNNMTFPTESLCPSMSETNVILPSNVKTQENIVESAKDNLECLEKTVIGHDLSSTTSCMKTTTENKTVLKISDYGGLQDQKQNQDVERELTQAKHSDLLISCHENLIDGINTYSEGNEESQITSTTSNIISTFQYEQHPSNEKISKEVKELFNQENEGFNHLNSTTGQDGNMSKNVQNSSEVFIGEKKESDSLENDISDEHKSPIPNSSEYDENMDPDCQKKEIQTDTSKPKLLAIEASSSKATTQLCECTSTLRSNSHAVESSLVLSEHKSDESVAQSKVCRSLPEPSENLLSDASVARLSEPSLQPDSFGKGIHFSVNEGPTSPGRKTKAEFSSDTECSGCLSLDTSDKNVQGVAIHVESSSSTEANLLLEKEQASVAEKTNVTVYPDPYCSHPAVNEDLSGNATEKDNSNVASNSDDSLQPQASSTDMYPSQEMKITRQLEITTQTTTTSSDQDCGTPSVTSDSLSIDAIDKKKQTISSHQESPFQQNSPSTDMHPSLEMEVTSQPEKKKPTSSPDQDFSSPIVTSDILSIDTCNTKKQSVDGHPESSIQPESLKTDLHLSLDMEVTSQSEKNDPASSPDRDFGTPIMTNDNLSIDTCDTKNQSVASHPESSVDPESLKTDIHLSLEMEVISQSENKSPAPFPDQDCSSPSIPHDSPSIDAVPKNTQSISSPPETPFQPKSLKTDLNLSFEMEVTSRSENKSSTSSPDRDCSGSNVPSDSPYIDAINKNKQTVSSHPESSLQPESLNTEMHFSLEMEATSHAEKKDLASSPDQDCCVPSVPSNSLSVDVIDKNKASVASNPELTFQQESQNTDLHPSLEMEVTSQSEKKDLASSPDQDCCIPSVPSNSLSTDVIDKNKASVASNPEPTFQQESQNTDLHPSLEMEVTSQSEKKDLASSPDQDCCIPSVPSNSLSIDVIDKNKASVASNPEPTFQQESQNTDLHPSLEMEVTSQSEKKDLASSPDQDCCVPSVPSNSLSIDVIDKNKASVASNPEPTFQQESQNTDLHPSLEMEVTSQSEKKDPAPSSDQDCCVPSVPSNSLSIDVIDKNKASVASNPEPTFQQESQNTDLHPSLEMEITSQSEKKDPASSPDQDCCVPSVPSNSLSIDFIDKNKASVASNPEPTFQQESQNTDLHPSLEMEVTSQSEKKDPTFSPDRDCGSLAVISDTCSVDTNDKQKQSVASHPGSSPQPESSNTDTHDYVGKDWTRLAKNTTSSTDQKYTSHVVTNDHNKQSVSNSLEPWLQPNPSSTDGNSYPDWTSLEVNKNTACFPDQLQSLHERPVDLEPPSLSEDLSENARDSFKVMNFSAEEQGVPDMLYGEPLSRDDSSCDSNETALLLSQYKETHVARPDGDSMDCSEGQAPQLQSSAQMRNLLHPVVVLQTLELTNGSSDLYYCGDCEHTTYSIDHLIKHHHCWHSLHNIEFCNTCNRYLVGTEQAEKHLCGVFKDRPSLEKNENRHGHYRCDRCRLMFSKRLQYIKHMRAHTGKTPFKCSDCGIYFAQAGSLRRHKRIPGRCKQSKVPVKNSNVVVSKSKTPKQKEVVHSDTNMLECYVKLLDISTTNLCGLCGKSFLTAAKAKKHLYNIHEGRGKVVSLNASAAKVRGEKTEEVHNEMTGKHKCPLCPRLFKYSYNRARHLRDCVRDLITDGKENFDGKYRCPLCHTMFSLPSNRYRHIKAVCLREFVNRLAKEKVEQRRKTEKQTTENEQKAQSKEKEQTPPALTAPMFVPRYKCNLCPAVFRHASGKYRHMKKHELFKLTGKMFKYKNSVFSFMPKQEPLNATKKDESKDNLKSAEASSSPSLSCHFCGKCFSLSKSLKKHEKNHRGERPYRCLECGKGFKKKSHLIGHKIVHQRRIQCTVCRKILPTIGELIQHRSTHLKRGTLKCPDCTMQFQHPASLLRHLKTHKNRENKTPELEETTPSKQQQSKESVKDQAAPNQIQCSLCKEVFDDAHVLRKHCLTHISGSNQCPFCKRSYNKRRNLLRHMTVHTGDKPLSCSTCGKQFYRDLFLEIHSQKCRPSQIGDLESKSKTRRRHKCSLCPRTFIKKDRFRNHLNAHKINSVVPCSRCGECYGTNKMKQHQKNCEETIELSAGLSPPNTTISKTNLKTSLTAPKTSLQSNATNLFEYKCPYCTQRYRFRSLFLRHLVSHTGVQPYACMRCGQRYRSQAMCLQHETFCDGVYNEGQSKPKSTASAKLPNAPALIETERITKVDGESEYKCKFCTKTFMKPRYLRRHILTHNEVKPYRCKACDSCFSRYDHLKVHQARCKGKKTRLEVRIPKVSLEDVGKGWQNKFGISSANKQEPFECKVCTRSFSSHSIFARHFTMFHAAKLFKCTGCGSSFAHEKSLRKHRKMRRCRKVLREKRASLLGTNPPVENVTGPLDEIKKRMLQRIQPCFNKKYKYVCSYCPRVFRNTWQLGVHTRLHTGEKPYSCDYCGERFVRKDYVQRHFPKCTKIPKQRTVLCDKCGGFFSVDKLEIHKKGCSFTPGSSLATVSQSQESTSQSPPKGFSCAYCSSRFLLFSQLQEHFLSAHKVETMTAPVSTAPLQQLLSNIKEEPVDESYDEKLCDNSNLIYKVNTDRDSEPPKQFFCQECNMFFANKAGLTGHLRIHAVGHPFNCKTCHRGFWNKSLLRNHYRKCRNGRIPTQQLEAPLKADFDFALNDSVHVFRDGSKTTSTGNLQTNFSCKEEVIDEISEGNEVQSSSSKDKKAVQYQCSECDMSFTDGLMLISHLEDHGRQEQEKKRNTCIKCGRVCTSQGNLEKHMRMHGIDLKSSCPDCSKSFYTISDLEMHRTCHDPSRPYVCKLCNQRFWTRPSLCSHYREDHEDDVFSCRFCSKSYAVKKSLTRHYKRWHPVEYKDLGTVVREKGSSEKQSSSQFSTTGESDEDENNGSEDSDSDSAPYFPCHVCGKTFPTSESLEDHQLCHLGEKPHECEECGKCFFQASQLQQHQRMHMSEFQCQTCGRGFVSLFALRKHKHSHGKSRSHRCSKCHLFFTGPLQLAEHMSTHREENFPCDICNRVFLSKSSRAEHWKSHSTSSDHPSPSVSGGEHEQSAAHSESSFALSTELKYRCGVCSERFRDPEELSEHGCMEAKERLYPCTVCNKHFLHASHLKKHRNTHHQSQSTSEYSCNQCSSSFSSPEQFLNHLESHAGTAKEIKREFEDEDEDGGPSKDFICPVCHQCFAFLTDLIDHFSTHLDGTIEKTDVAPGSKRDEHEQDGETPAPKYECTACGQSFLEHIALSQHECFHHQKTTKTEHSKTSFKKSSPSYFQAAGEEEEEEEVDIMGDDLYNCLVCSMQFTSKNILLEHQNKEHPNEKPFTCELCGKTFARRRYLREHERRHRQRAQSDTQSEESQFKCARCQAKFTTVQDLSLHMRMHAEKEVGEYRCDMCYKSFSQWSLLKQHQESHVGEVVYECTECDKAFAFPHLLEEHQQTHAGSSE